MLKHSLFFSYLGWGFLEVLLGGNIAGGSRSFQAGLDGTVQKDRHAGLRFAAFGGMGWATIRLLCRSTSCVPEGIINSVRRRKFN